MVFFRSSKRFGSWCERPCWTKQQENSRNRGRTMEPKALHRFIRSFKDRAIYLSLSIFLFSFSFSFDFTLTKSMLVPHPPPCWLRPIKKPSHLKKFQPVINRLLWKREFYIANSNFHLMTSACRSHIFGAFFFLPSYSVFAFWPETAW